MRKSKLWKKLLGVEHLVFEDGDIETAPDGRGGTGVRCPARAPAPEPVLTLRSAGPLA